MSQRLAWMASRSAHQGDKDTNRDECGRQADEQGGSGLRSVSVSYSIDHLHRVQLRMVLIRNLLVDQLSLATEPYRPGRFRHKARTVPYSAVVLHDCENVNESATGNGEQTIRCIALQDFPEERDVLSDSAGRSAFGHVGEIRTTGRKVTQLVMDHNCSVEGHPSRIVTPGESMVATFPINKLTKKHHFRSFYWHRACIADQLCMACQIGENAVGATCLVSCFRNKCVPTSLTTRR